MLGIAAITALIALMLGMCWLFYGPQLSEETTISLVAPTLVFLSLGTVLGFYALRRPSASQTSYYQPVKLKNTGHKWPADITGLELAFTNRAYAEKFSEANQAAVAAKKLKVANIPARIANQNLSDIAIRAHDVSQPGHSGSKFDEPQDEPLFMALSRSDPDMHAAHQLAANTIAHFRAFIAREGEYMCCAKLRFRDPDLSEELGEDRFCFMWLNDVHYHEKENVFSGVFFEVPPEFTKWHRVGQRLTFDGDDMFDWMVHDDGRLHGAFTMRVARQKLSESERAAYDRFVGAEVWEPLPS